MPGTIGIAAAAFDTRIKVPELLAGSAAKGAAKRLKALGFRVLTPMSFFIDGASGDPFDQMSSDELGRARAWGVALAAGVREPELARSC